ncbi:MAG: ABC transporter substrate-binding protein [Oscillospiraceae bacterium]|nr:ABC transporter substrate-binding protein [Oscillospiraceae bacterium]
MKKLSIILILYCCLIFFTACQKTAPEQNIINQTETMKLDYAEQFSVLYYPDGCAEISINDGNIYLLVPEDVEIPEHNANQIILQQPLENIYLAASSAMDLFASLDSLDRIALTSTKDWSIPSVQYALDSGALQYAGKYSMPDYELLLENHCNIAIESTMIYHSPDVKEQIQQLGVPVFIERSSYESHPLGRMEWIKLYGLLLGKLEQAEEFFNQKAELFQEITNSVAEDSSQTKKTVAFFYISPNGYVNIRKPNDYISHMIELAGGEYIFTEENLNLEKNNLSTMNIQTEVFYEIAKNADIFIYNSLIDDELQSIDELLEKSSILADCKAVQNGNVWCAGQNLFQQSTNASEMLADFYAVLHDDSKQGIYFMHKLT